MAGKIGNVWGETLLISLAAQSGTDATMEDIVTYDSVDIDGLEKDFEQIVTAAGGRLESLTPQGPVTVTFEAYPLEVGSGDVSAATAIVGFFDVFTGTEDTTGPKRLTNSRARDRYRLTITVTSDTSLTNAASQLIDGQSALRLAFADGFITRVKPMWTDGGNLKFEVTFKCNPFDSTGTSNFLFESVAGTGTITALASYTSSAKF